MIALLVLISGRRGDAAFFLWGGAKLLQLSFRVAWICPLWLIFSYLAEVVHFNAPLSQKFAPLLSGQGLAWTTTLGAFLLAQLFLRQAMNQWAALPTSWPQDRLILRQCRHIVSFCFLASGGFFATLVLFNWPFGGLPEGLPWDRAVQAILRHAMRDFFMAFSPGGALAMLALYGWQRQMDASRCTIAVRWFAFWALAGSLPHWIVSMGLRLGMGSSSAGAVAQGLAGQGPMAACLTGSLACWVFLLWRPSYWRFLAILGSAFLLLPTLLPFIHALLR